MLFEKFENGIESFTLFGEVNPRFLYTTRRPFPLTENFRLRTREVGTSLRVSAQATVEAEKKLLKHLRFGRGSTPLDTITFSLDAIKNVEKLLGVFNTIAGGQLFVKRNPPVFSGEKMPYQLPFWFIGAGTCTISAWVVAHFEARIIEYYSRDRLLREISAEPPTKTAEKLCKAWALLDDLSKKETIENVLQKIGDLSDMSFASLKDPRIQNYDYSKEELTFATIFNLNY